MPRWLLGLTSLLNLLALSAGLWLIVFALWDGWPEGQLIGLNATIGGIVLGGAGALVVGMWVGWVAGRRSASGGPRPVSADHPSLPRGPVPPAWEPASSGADAGAAVTDQPPDAAAAARQIPGYAVEFALLGLGVAAAVGFLIFSLVHG